MSFTATVQMLGSLWLYSAITGEDELLRELFVTHPTSIRVGLRPDRREPRANKRRLKIPALLTKPCAVVNPQAKA